MALSYPTIKKKSTYAAPVTKKPDGSTISTLSGANPYEYNPGGNGGEQQSGTVQPQSYYNGQVENRTALSSLPENLAKSYQDTLASMVSGSAYKPYQTSQASAMNKAAQQLRSNAQAANVGRVGQGTAIANKSAVESSIASMAGETALNASMGAQEMRERGISASNTLAGMNENVRNTDIARGMQTDTAYGYIDRLTGNRIKGSNELAEKEIDIQQQQVNTTRDLGYAGLSSNEKIAFANIGMDEKRLGETARQFDISTDQASKQFMDNLKLNYDQLDQNQKQFMSSFGLDQAKFEQAKSEFKVQSDIQREQINANLKMNYDQLDQNQKQFMASLGFDKTKFEQAKVEFDIQTTIQREQLAVQKDIAVAQIGMDQNRLNESARQFNIGTDEAESQFKRNLQKDYDQLTSEEKRFMDSLGLDKDKFNESKYQFAVQTDIQREEMSMQKDIAMTQISVSREQIAENARQFGLSIDQAERQFTENMNKEYAQLTQQDKQFMASFGLDEAKFNESKVQFKSSLLLEKEKIQQNERIATNTLNLEATKLVETARQFNVSTDQVAKQFTSKLKFDYDSLSQSDQQFMQQLGFNKQQFEQSKVEFEKSYSLQDKLQSRDLDIKEKGLAQDAQQFSSRIDFDTWATQAGLDDAASNRVWQASQNDKAIVANKDIQFMLNDTDRWKTEKTVELTKLGYGEEFAIKQLERDQELRIFYAQSNLTKDIESGRISQQEADRVQQASQFGTQLDWMKQAKKLDISESDAQRTWATHERLSTQVYNKTESSFDRQVQLSIAAGEWLDPNTGKRVNSIAQKQLLESARQFDTSEEWQREAALQGFSSWEAQRTWEETQKIEDQQFQIQLNDLQSELQLKGIKIQTTMSYLQSLEPEAASDVIEALALDAGMSYVLRDNKGDIIRDASDKPVTRDGFPPVKTNASQLGYDLAVQLETGELTTASLRRGNDPNSPNYKNYQALKETVPTYKLESSYNSKAERVNVTNAPKQGTIIKMDNILYRVVSGLSGERRQADKFTVENLVDGSQKTIQPKW